MDKNIFYNHLFKVILIGEPGVGKTSLITRFADGTFAEEGPAVDFKTKVIVSDSKTIKLHIWDTTGPQIPDKCIWGTQGVLLVYDVTRKASLKALKKWLRKIDKHVGVDVQKLLVANKCDRGGEEGVVDFYAAGEAFAEKMKIPIMAASSKNNLNVGEVFMSMAKKIMAAKIKAKEESNSKLEGCESIVDALDRMWRKYPRIAPH